jgi:hypothetical protein
VIRPSLRSWVFHSAVSRYSLAYAALLITLAIVAIVPPQPNVIAYAILFVLALPVSCAALVASFLSAALIFQDPGRNDVLVHLWVLFVWIIAISAQAVLFEQLRRSRARL